ncbi:MAG TPA: ceramide glucosyltransferase [Anaeromyxobacteraceae bacterium]|nr:ceramide glucosyltransferase [Anaeromyxobacteraceae bacterium]
MNPSHALFAASLLGVLLVGLQVIVLRRHVRAKIGAPADLPGISILKPLCGVDEDLGRSLEVFAGLDYPQFEVLLGVKDPVDPAWPLAAAAAARWPGRFRLVRQQGEPGLNPKVNQLITLSRAARYDVLVVSDSNVRVRPGYLREIAAHLGAEDVGLVTHPIVGVGEHSIGALFENLHLAASVATGMVAAKQLAGRDVVVGKSMALRRRDLDALGGFECVKDVLAEDYVLGVKVPSELGKRVAIASEPVENVNQDRPLSAFVSRYTRWCVMQRKIAGSIVYGSQVFLNPVAFAVAAAVVSPEAASATLLAAICAAKAVLDDAAARTLRGRGFRWRWLLLAPVKDLVFAVAWARGFVWNTVTWRGHRLRVLPGSALAPTQGRQPEEMLEDVERTLATEP